MMLLPTATTPLQQALLTRAFLLQRSQGPFNALFTGEILFSSSCSFFSRFLSLFSLSSLSSLSLSAVQITLTLSVLLFRFPRHMNQKKLKIRKRLHRLGRRRRLRRRVDRVPLLGLLLQVAPSGSQDHYPLLPQRRQRRGADQRQLPDADTAGAVDFWDFFCIVCFNFFLREREKNKAISIQRKTKKKSRDDNNNNDDGSL